jgi:hypothetical protein
MICQTLAPQQANVQIRQSHLVSRQERLLPIGCFLVLNLDKSLCFPEISEVGVEAHSFEVLMVQCFGSKLVIDAKGP